MFYFKACNKCQGDLVREDDFYGAYFRCMQCGSIVEVNARETGLPLPLVKDAEPAELVA
jgi:DNA-directed RNA polymerase subunit RPC12/RpoP